MKFLIQKEGERDWLPLDSHHTLREGTYRVVAESEYRGKEVEICVTHEGYTGGVYQSDRSLHHRRANDRGLIMVIPYTHLVPGNWEIRISSDVMSDLLGEGWQVSQQLTVLPLGAPLSSPNPDVEFYKARLCELLKTEIEPFLIGEAERRERGTPPGFDVITIELQDTATNSSRSFDLSVPPAPYSLVLDLPEMDAVNEDLALIPSLSSLPPKLSSREGAGGKKSPRLPVLPGK